jgi:hypothetical protein
MRYRKILATAVLAAIPLAGAATAIPASAVVTPRATSVCANNSDPCTNISSLLLNQNNDPQFVQNATTGQAVNSTGAGRRLNLRQLSDTRTNEDFIIRKVGTIGQLCPNLIFPVPGSNSLDPTSYACLNYPFFYPVYQAKFAPNSVVTGACVGAISATEGFKMRLEPCGSKQTFWVGDLASSITVTVPSPISTLIYFPLEFAADTSASNPLVATLTPGGSNPVNKLTLQRENFSGGSVPDRQMFTLTQ